jgi:hypothetical protein
VCIHWQCSVVSSPEKRFIDCSSFFSTWYLIEIWVLIAWGPSFSFYICGDRMIETGGDILSQGILIQEFD